MSRAPSLYELAAAFHLVPSTVVHAVTLFAPVVVTISDWVGPPGVDAADTVLGFNTGLALACLQLLHMWAVMERITTTHPLFVALAELGVRDSVISRKLLLLDLGELSIHSPRDLARALDSDEVRPLVKAICGKGLEFDKICDIKTYIHIYLPVAPLLAAPAR